MEHVEVLRHMKETIKAIMPSEVAALDAAIAALSAQQPAAVDEAMVERFCGRWFQLTGRSLDRPSVRACLTEALAAQQGGSDNDR